MSDRRSDVTSEVARDGAPEAVVAVLIQNGRILAIKRGPGVLLPGYWTLPSGRIEPDESQAEALIREVREEVGLDIEPLAKVWECPTDDGEWKLYWWTAEVVPGELELDQYEVAEARWVSPEGFLHLKPTFVGDREFFEHVLPTLDLAPR